MRFIALRERERGCELGRLNHKASGPSLEKLGGGVKLSLEHVKILCCSSCSKSDLVLVVKFG
jgi:hypothetical protein